MREYRRIQGIDVSQWQGRIDFARVKADGIRIVYIKATQGDDETDPDFERNYRDAQKEGLAIGFYHYVTALSSAEAQTQARFFASRLRGKMQHARAAMDFEQIAELAPAAIREIALTFLRALEEEIGHRPVIYTDSYNAARSFADDRLREYPLWIADYGVTRPDMENPWRHWSGWQYTDRGSVSGIAGAVDRDYFRRSILLDTPAALCKET